MGNNFYKLLFKLKSVLAFKNIALVILLLPVNGFIRKYKPPQVKYHLNTTDCKIPEYNLLFRDTTRQWDCGERLVNANKVPGNKVQFTLRIPFQSCCYMNLWFTDKIERDKCRPFKNGTKIHLEQEFIYVNCTFAELRNYRDFYVFVKKQNVKMAKSNDAYNVLILGLDSISRHRANSALRLSVRYLLKNKWFDFKGYTKASTSTTNIIPLLTGVSYYQYATMTKQCVSNATACQDLHVWSQFEKAGYVTASAEDSSHLRNIFATNEPWFPNTNHDISSFFKFVEFYRTGTICAGHRQAGLVMLNYILEFSIAYKNSKYFQFFWISSFVRDFKNPPKSADTNFKDFLVKLDKSGVLNTTIVMILSDRGFRKNDMFGSKYYRRHSREVFYDNSLPMLFMWTPPSFKNKYPTEFLNLKKNQNRLTSVYDIHATLKNILNWSDKKKSKVSTAKGCYTSKSLFENITEDRTCADICTVNEYCSCLSKKQEMDLLYSSRRIIRVHVPKAIPSKQQLRTIEKVTKKPRHSYGSHTFREKMLQLEERIRMKKFESTTESERKRKIKKFRKQLAAFSTPYWFDY